LGFASDVLRTNVKKENLTCATGHGASTGSTITVRCVITAKRSTIPTEVDDDGMVAAALRDLGGKIVDIQ
jgi:hypothetical protein